MDHRTIVSFFTCQLVWVNRYLDDLFQPLAIALQGANVPVGAQAGAQPGAQTGAQAAKTPATQAQASAQAQKPAASQAPQYDFIFQVAAFKSADDADKLRKKLEERGIRTRLEKSGKVQLVMVNLRGSDLDASNLREELGRMKLGAPIQKSKKAVPGKSRSTGR